MSAPAILDLAAHRALRNSIIAAQDGLLARCYAYIRFRIIDLNILHLLALCLRGRTRVLEVGCGYGLAACYLAARFPGLVYHGMDLDANRIAKAREAALRLGLTNVHFECADARERLALDDEYDAILLVDLLHHIPDDAKRRLLEAVLPRVAPGGSLVIKDITLRPRYKLAFTWLLDVAMTAGFDMWYWNEAQFRAAIPEDWQMDVFPITHWLPYPHVLMVVDR